MFLTMSDKDKSFTSSLEHKIDGLIKDFGEYKAFNTEHLKNLDQRLGKVEESSKNQAQVLGKREGQKVQQGNHCNRRFV